jgi:hypothetical protein
LVEVDDRQKVRLDLWCSTHALSDIAPAKKFQTKIVFQQTAKGKQKRAFDGTQESSGPVDG